MRGRVGAYPEAALVAFLIFAAVGRADTIAYAVTVLARDSIALGLLLARVHQQLLMDCWYRSI